MNLNQLSSPESEQALLGSMLLSADFGTKALSALEASDFYEAPNRIIFETLDAMVTDGKPIDVGLLAGQLNQAGRMVEVGGVGYFEQVRESVYDLANADYHLRAVKQRALYRRTVEAASQIQALTEDGMEPSELASQIQNIALSLTPDRAGDSLYDVRQNALIVAQGLREPSNAVPMGYRDVDEITSGLESGTMTIVAARPSMGKTSLACGVAYNVAKSGGKVVFVSLEQEPRAITERLIFADAGISRQSQRQGLLTSEQWARIDDSARDIATLPIVIVKGAETPGAVNTHLQRAKKLLGHVDLLILDYCQLLVSGKRTENRVQDIGAISRALKQLALREDMPVLLLSQLNREVEARADHRPRLSDLRGSGDLEQDSDVVLLLHREDQYHRGQSDYSPTGLCDVHVAKSREGPTGTAQLVFVAELAKLADKARGGSDFDQKYGQFPT